MKNIIKAIINKLTSKKETINHTTQSSNKPVNKTNTLRPTHTYLTSDSRNQSEINRYTSRTGYITTTTTWQQNETAWEAYMRKHHSSVMSERKTYTITTLYK